MPDMEHSFVVRGSFAVKENAKPLISQHFGHIWGFKLPNGSEVRLVVALEVENKDGKISYVTSEKQMGRLGFSAMEYDKAHWEPGTPIIDPDEVLHFDS